MIRISITSEERHRLEELRRTSHSRAAERCYYLLLNSEGWSVPQIAQSLKRNEHTIRSWLKSYQSSGFLGL